ncbi:PIG-L deacetylase family protein [Pseudomonas asplenii]|uniref:PIG-L deacetylase family protein n=1 Tax=Pseudomonas asplenii TaxID=53407 RepID=UPI002360092D|nr:PIG-L deacetylase family protein [Pseudomonas asplenii]
MSTAMDSKAIEGTGTPLADWQRSVSLAGVPPISRNTLVPDGCRLVVVAPHPDDEVLMCGGLLAVLAQQSAPNLLLISVTDGEASHRGSTRWTEHRLRQVRPRESLVALHELGLKTTQLQWLRLGLPDSDVARHEPELCHDLSQWIEPGDRVITTWREDGHADHEAVGRACAGAARQRQAMLFEAPVWAWHWALPNDARLPWKRARKLSLDASTLSLKRRAIAAHRSQTVPDQDTAPVLQAHALERLLQPFELVFT